MKYFWHTIHILQILFSVTMCVLFPFWVSNGYLNETYPIVGAFVASYGGFIGGVIWYYRNYRHIQ
jgi:hypothetical protein